MAIRLKNNYYGIIISEMHKNYASLSLCFIGPRKTFTIR